MGSGIVNEEAARIEHSLVLLVIAAIIIHCFSKYSILGIDATVFMVFAAMCFAGYFALKTVQEIISAIEERKQAAYETLKTENFKILHRNIAPVAFNNSSRYSKYAAVSNRSNYYANKF